MPTPTDVHAAVREHYGQIAAGGGSCCGPASACCGGGVDQERLAQALGYSQAELSAVPEGANLGLSCGNPTALASLRPGEVVLDLGSGAGFDAFIAAARVGAEGHVHGVDMTREMVGRARHNAAAFKRRTGLANLSFHQGQIEALPLPDASVDVVISNCVINLSPDQPRVWRELSRVLRPGGRVSVSDLALRRPLPEAVKADVLALVGCIAGAALLEETLSMMREASLVDVQVQTREGSLEALLDPSDPLHQRILAQLPPGSAPSDFVTSALFTARKPG